MLHQRRLYRIKLSCISLISLGASVRLKSLFFNFGCLITCVSLSARCFPDGSGAVWISKNSSFSKHSRESHFWCRQLLDLDFLIIVQHIVNLRQISSLPWHHCDEGFVQKECERWTKSKNRNYQYNHSWVAVRFLAQVFCQSNFRRINIRRRSLLSYRFGGRLRQNRCLFLSYNIRIDIALCALLCCLNCTVVYIRIKRFEILPVLADR